MTPLPTGTFSLTGKEYSKEQLHLYSCEQYEALQTMKDQSYADGIARDAYVNHTLLPDGSIVEGVEPLYQLLDGAIAEAIASPTRVSLAAAGEAARLKEEIAEHVTQGRFLFIPIEQGARLIYFQCAVAHNPDLPELREAE